MLEDGLYFFDPHKAALMRHGQFVVDLPAPSGNLARPADAAIASFPSEPLPANFVLEPHDAFQQRFGPRRAAGNVDVDRNHQIYPANNVVAIFKVRAAGDRTGAHRHDVLRLAICSYSRRTRLAIL